jgi:hypothetical protein
MVRSLRIQYAGAWRQAKMAESTEGFDGSETLSGGGTRGEAMNSKNLSTGCTLTTVAKDFDCLTPPCFLAILPPEPLPPLNAYLQVSGE